MSRQQDIYLRARSAGSDAPAACALSGIPEAEARFIESDIAKGVITLAPHPLNHNQNKTQERPMKNTNAGDEILLLIERWERLDEEKKGLAEDQKDVMAEARSRGYDTKTIREIIRLRKLSEDQRREREALLDTYKAALGMLDGTPLGTWALKRLSPAQPEPEPEGGAAAPAPGKPKEPEKTVEEARQMGRDAARAGQSVTTNPFPARDPRRAAWDEAWCQELGTDGMDIPDALKPAPKEKKPKGGGGEAAGGDEPEGSGE